MDKAHAQSAKPVTHVSLLKTLLAQPLNGQSEAVTEMDSATSMLRECTQLTTTTLSRVTIATRDPTQSMAMETHSFGLTPKPAKTVQQDTTAQRQVKPLKCVHLDNICRVLVETPHAGLYQPVTTPCLRQLSNIFALQVITALVQIECLESVQLVTPQGMDLRPVFNVLQDTFALVV